MISNIVRYIGKKFNSAGACGYLNWIPDKLYLQMLYWFRMGKVLHLSHPKSFNEKIQWLKLYDRKPEYTLMVDKEEAKKYVAECLGEQYIIPTLQVWDCVDEIDIDSLPEQFVLKCTHDSGGLYVCKEKNNMDRAAVMNKLNSSMNTNFFWNTREWPYRNVKPRIIAEKYMEQTDGSGLTDYKFFCFHGKPEFLYVSTGLDCHATAKISFYDLNWNEMSFCRNDYQPFHHAQRPQNFEEMKRVAQQLAMKVNAPFVRIDLYSINERVYFSEITFSPCGGMLPFDPIETDMELGRMLDVEKR